MREAARELRDEGVEAVAVCFLFSYLNPDHERRAAAIVREEMPAAFVTTSADIFPQFREFERFTTATMSAFVGPRTGNYLDRLATALAAEGVEGELHVMMSSGGVASVRTAAERPVTLLLSGPAAGILGGQWAGALAGRRRLITFDMGGTSADIGIVTEDGVSEASARDTWVGGYPLLVPMLDVHTIGAGGGSIAYVDEGGAFRVGPRSAGAAPGPAAYGQGGQEPTITDAHVVLGRLDPDRFLGGRMTLHRDAAVTVVEKLAEQLGLGLLESRGGDPHDRELEHGAGDPLAHDREGTRSARVRARRLWRRRPAPCGGRRRRARDTGGARPPHPGITSAAGLLTSDLKYDQMRTVFQLQGSVDADRLNRELDELEEELRSWLARDGVPVENIEVIRALDCRYVGQGYELRVTLGEGPFTEEALAQFHVLHEREYGSAYGDPIEIVNARVTATGRRPTLESPPVTSGTLEEALVGESESVFRVDGSLQAFPTRFYDRSLLPLDEAFAGPAVVFHLDTTTVIPPGWSARADASGNLILNKGGAS